MAGLNGNPRARPPAGGIRKPGDAGSGYVPPPPQPKLPPATAAPWSWSGVVSNVAGQARNQTPAPKKPGIFQTPGHGETWWTENQGKFNAPSNAATYWQGAQGFFNNAGQQRPSAAQGAYSNLGAWYNPSGPGQGSTNARDIAGGMRNPGQGEDFIGRAMGFFNGPGSGETYISGIQDQFGRAGTGEQNAYNSLGWFQQQGDAEKFFGGLQPRLAGIQYGGQAIGDAAATRAQAQNAGRFFGQNQDQFTAGASTVGNEYGFFAPGLREKSYSEDLYESGNEGLNMFYGREADKLQKRLNDQAAAMGMFGSGFNARLNQEGLAELGSQQARDMASLAGQADQARLGRTGAALAFTSGIEDSVMGRLGLGATAARGADQSALEGGRLTQDALGFASDEARDKLRIEGSAADAAQRNAIERVLRGGELGLKADDARFGRLERGANVSALGQRLGMERTNYGIGAAKSLQDLQMERLFKGGQLGIQADAADDSRAAALFGMGRDLDQGDRDWMRTQSQIYRDGAGIASDVDQVDTARLLGQGDMAFRAQGALEGRERTGFDIDLATYDRAAAMFGQDREAADEQVRLQMEAINQILSQGNLSAQQQQQLMNMMTGILNTGLQGRRVAG